MLLLMVSLVLGTWTTHKVFVCDPQLEAASEREAQLVSSLKRLQGTLANRATQGVEDMPIHNTRFSNTASTGTGASSTGLTLADKVSYDRRIADKELQAQRAHKAAAACQSQLQALVANVTAGSADAAVAAEAAVTAASVASEVEARRLRKATRVAEQRALAAEEHALGVELQLKAARMEVQQLSLRLRIQPPHAPVEDAKINGTHPGDISAAPTDKHGDAM
jgi:hypothetical protein